MQIVSRAQWAHQLSCARCSSVLRIEESDLKFSQYDTGAHITCPVCQGTNTVPNSVLSEDIKWKMGDSR